MWAPAILRFARVIRCAIVVSGTRNAAAISATVSPPSSRSVRATRASGASAGWQQVKISRSRSSSTGPVGSWGSGSCIISACRCLSSRRDSRRIRSMARLPAVVVSQPPGLGGMPSVAPLLQRHHQRLAGGVLGDVEVAEPARQGRHHAAELVAEDPLDRGVEVAPARHAADHSAWNGRTSTWPAQAAEPSCGPAQRRVQVGRLDDPEAAQPLLGLGERAVGRRRPPRRCCRRWSRSRAASARRRTPRRRPPAAGC